MPDPNWEDFENPITQREIQALLVQRGFQQISVISYSPPSSEVLIEAYFSKPRTIFWIRQSRNKKGIDIGFPAPVNLGWDRGQFSLSFDVERERKRRRSFKEFLEKLLKIIEDGTKPHGRMDVDKRITQELRE